MAIINSLNSPPRNHKDKLRAQKARLCQPQEAQKLFKSMNRLMVRKLNSFAEIRHKVSLPPHKTKKNRLLHQKKDPSKMKMLQI